MEEVNNGTITTLPIPDAGHMNKHGRFEQIEAYGEGDLYALDTKGVVWYYRFVPKDKAGWLPMAMTRYAE